MATNKPVFYRSVTEITARAAELGLASDQFVTGANRGVASGAIGINTGDFDPKDTDFARITTWANPASYIGKLDEAIADNEEFMWGITGEQLPALEISTRVGFDQAASDTAADADYGTLPVTNYTGKTIPADSWAWGFEAVGGSVVAPIISAGPPQYFGIVIEFPNYETMTMAGTATPGSDPAPTYYWSILSGIPDNSLSTWSDRTSLTTTFKPAGYALSGGDIIVLALTATVSDGPPVVSTVVLTYAGLGTLPTVDAGGPYTYTTPLPDAIQLAGSVTGGSDPAPFIVWGTTQGADFTGTFDDQFSPTALFTLTSVGAQPVELALIAQGAGQAAVEDTATITQAGGRIEIIKPDGEKDNPAILLCNGDFLAGEAALIQVVFTTPPRVTDEDAFSLVLSANITAAELAAALAQDIDGLPRYTATAINDNVFIQPTLNNRLVSVIATAIN